MIVKGGFMARTKGALGKRSILPKSLTADALVHLTRMVSDGDQKAVLFVMEREYPALKAITPADSIDADYIRAKIFELTELEKRIAALEENNNG